VAERSTQRRARLAGAIALVALIAASTVLITRYALLPDRLDQEAADVNYGPTQDGSVYVGEWRWQTDAEGAFLMGDIRNETADTLEFVELQFALLNPRGGQVGGATGLIERLVPGEVRQYRIMVDSPTANQARLQNVITPYSQGFGHGLAGEPAAGAGNELGVPDPPGQGAVDSPAPPQNDDDANQSPE
jgi:hypothetical protein